MKEKMGRFFVPSDIIQDGLGPIVYQGLVPLEVSFAVDRRGYRVLAIGDQFDPPEHGCYASEYVLGFERSEPESEDAVPVLRAVFAKIS